MKHWSEDDKAFLEDNYSKLSAKSIGKQLSRSTKAVRAMASFMGLRKTVRWEGKRLELMKAHWPDLHLISKLTGASPHAVRVAGNSIGLTLKSSGIAAKASRAAVIARRKSWNWSIGNVSRRIIN